MVDSNTAINVAIKGDSKDLRRAAGESNRAIQGIGNTAKIAGGIIAGAFAVDAVVDFAQSALSETDRVGDATSRLREQLGDLSEPLIDASERFHDLGLSRGDMLELQARIADIGTAAGIADKKLAPMATSVAEAAGALSLITDMDAATVVDLIGKAAGGADKPLKDLGINLSDAEVAARAMEDTGKKNAKALTDGELAAARMELILEKLAPRVEGVTGAEADLETQQRTLQAKFETFTGKVGEALEGPLTDLLTWALAMADALGESVDQFGAFRRRLDQLEGPTRDYVELLRQIFDLFGKINPALGLGGAVFGAPSANRTPSNSAPHPGIVVQVQGGSPEVVEQAVVDAVIRARSTGRIP